MLNSIRQIALDFLASELDAKGDTDSWYSQLRRDNPEKILSWLVESPDGNEHFYTLTADKRDAELAILEVHELQQTDHRRLPFNQGTGSQSPALGPIIKRTIAKKGAGPTLKIQKTTLDSFKEIATQGKPWSYYFNNALNCFERPKLKYKDQILDAESGAYAKAIEAIEETKNTVLLVFEDDDGRLPGEVPEYGQYLQGILAETKYSTSKATKVNNQSCSICGEISDVYPNAIRGAGINLANVDRDGAFAGMDIENAWKHLALCSSCADLIYVFSFHLKDDFKTRIAGENALVIPTLSNDEICRRKFVIRFKEWVKAAKTDRLGFHERGLLKLLASDSDSINEITILWADFGQRIDNVRGVLAEVIPSRLGELVSQNVAFAEKRHPAFPEHPLDEFEIDLPLNFLLDLFKRPGGKKAKRENEGKRLFDLRRSIAEAVYHKRDITESRTVATFFAEIMMTARWHLMDLLEDGQWDRLLYEGYSKKKQTAFLTFAGWIRQIAKVLHYFRTIGVLPMPGTETIYQPEFESLKPFFTKETAIDSESKAFAFVLGVLYGKVMQVQAARGVNVGSNALTWLKRLTLKGTDLPELYVKVREKLLAYETEKSQAVRDLVSELGSLGSRVNFDELGELNETDTCYFLLLGQSLATTVLPTKKSEDKGDN